ncbi:MAG: CHAD domain-containing protein [Gammaproteobacteria bacterium]|nr:CHAD domain-containing protein [Gammaproteobacteria bacterium]
MKSNLQQNIIQLVPEHIDFNNIKVDLLRYLNFNVVENEETNQVKTIHFLDTFNLSCFKQKLFALKHTSHFNLMSDDRLLDYLFSMQASADNDLHRVETEQLPKFWWQFTQPKLRSMLKKIIGLRALTDIGEGIFSNRQLKIQNEENKTIAVVILLEARSLSNEQNNSFKCIKIQSVRGYNKELKQILKLFQKSGSFTPQQSIIKSLFHSLNIRTEIFDIKPQINIEPQTPVRTMTNQLIDLMLSKIRQTEPGLIGDVDTEFLHHYRVALRMVRAVITQLKEVYQVNDVVDLKLRFGNLAKKTNHLRDLDVFILDKNKYLELLPTTLQVGLLPLFQDINEQRDKEFVRVKNWLLSDEYIHEIDNLQQLFSNNFGSGETLWSETPCLDIAIIKINKRYKKINRATQLITKDTSDEEIHELRIECKKLRYLLYFFASLFEQNNFKKVIKKLKVLQDSLGIFNDLSVQIDFLQHYLNQLIKSSLSQKNTALAASLGGLITALTERQNQQRQVCIEQLIQFGHTDVQLLMNQTFISSDNLKTESTI